MTIPVTSATFWPFFGEVWAAPWIWLMVARATTLTVRVQVPVCGAAVSSLLAVTVTE